LKCINNQIKELDVRGNHKLKTLERDPRVIKHAEAVTPLFHGLEIRTSVAPNSKSLQAVAGRNQRGATKWREWSAFDAEH
jgi:hypothetical protein